MQFILKQNISNRLLCFIIFSVVSLASANAFSHGISHASHGGVVKEVGDMLFELVVHDDSVDFYLLDDSEEVDSGELQAKLKITANGEKSELKLTPAGGNKFSVNNAKIASGSKVLVLVTLQDGYSKVGARFTIE